MCMPAYTKTSKEKRLAQILFSYVKVGRIGRQIDNFVFAHAKALSL
uniref:Uncharacterized protein n=1 Tax=Setaria italica TaxID=4555 RepID=K3YF90_SETIT